ncbi:hypothetical protein ROLI_040400 [Roseobacter fucihabitans]|uniref:Solute-binding protein family 5 domain-containing protein n=1 Tax=Roseobacter fucihabitans TaxID=1537242 RepID=A0ABZ2BXX9_9RHOB|nr:putative D,D-dipeptide-binding periplasmic protein DdpA precursor [Roseobacter litoralis]MBC6965817.1 putative D,D-dipeptide-binding periplasmic protein DdpA precursor [Roseobacter litoralis]
MTRAASAEDLSAQVEADFGQLDPAFWQSTSDVNVIHAIFPKLIEFKNSETWDWELSSAESIEQVDELTIRFKLKPGLMWTNGYGEVTAEDVEYSFERFNNEALAASNAGDWAPLKDVEVVDTYTGLIHLNEPFAPIWWSTLPYAAGSIISKKATEEQGGTFTTAPKATAGPYKIDRWDQGQRTVLVAHEGWNGDTTVQTCIVHLVRHSLNFCGWKDRKNVAKDLKRVYSPAWQVMFTSPRRRPPVTVRLKRLWLTLRLNGARNILQSPQVGVGHGKK